MPGVLRRGKNLPYDLVTAIEEKIRRESDRKRAEEWIEALKKNPEDLEYAEDWLRAEGWGLK